MVANEGTVATLTVYVSGNPRPDVYWRKGRRDIDVQSGKFRIIDGATLQVRKYTFAFPKVRKSWWWLYEC